MLTDLSSTYKPFGYDWAEEYRKQSEDLHWVTDEVEMGKDVEDYNNASEEERGFIKNILSIFTQSDFNVANNYLPLLVAIKNNEVRGMLTSFMCREFEHQKGYAYLNESLGFPDSYYTDFLKHQETLDKDLYMRTQTHGNFGLALAKGILLEGISLFGSFIMLKNFERAGKYLGMCTINEWSLRDESLHVEGNAKLFRVWCQENPNEVNDTFKLSIYSMAREIVAIEQDFVRFAFNTYSPPNLEQEDVVKYIEYIADRRLVQLGLKPNFDIETNPLPWMDELNNGSSFANFFEKRVTDYAVAGMTGEFSY